MVFGFDPFRDVQTGIALATRQRGSFGALDVWRRDDQVVVEVDAPGVDPADVEVVADGEELVIRLERPAPVEEGADVVLNERSGGSVVRRIRLGRRYALDRVTATAANGVVRLVAPVAEAARPRRIEVTTGSDTSTTAGTLGSAA